MAVPTDDGQLSEMVPNEHRGDKTPSYVAYLDDEVVLGQKALDRAVAVPENVVFGVRYVCLLCLAASKVEREAEVAHAPDGSSAVVSLSIPFCRVISMPSPTQSSTVTTNQRSDSTSAAMRNSSRQSKFKPRSSRS